MTRHRTFFTAMIIGGAIGLAPAASWAQSSPGSPRPSTPEPSRPGASEGVPSKSSVAQELSQNDMKMIQQRLQDKGYKPGNIDGTADEATRAAIKKFQQDEGIPVTGSIDETTANRLGFRYSKGPASRGGAAGEQPTPGQQPPSR